MRRNVEMSAQRAIQASNDSTQLNAMPDQKGGLFLGNGLFDGRELIVVPTIGRISNDVLHVGSAWRRALASIIGRVLLWRDRARGRTYLVQLDARLRADIGVTPVDVWREVNKPFWRE
jgi:uncharacterized protein YjiS (DUF1127 family)